MDCECSIDDTVLDAEIYALIGQLNTDQKIELLEKLQEMNCRKQRRSERKQISLQVDYCIGDRFYRDITENVSSGGAFIGTFKTFNTGESFHLAISDQKRGQHVKLEGSVVRKETNGFAVSFFPVTADQKHQLEKLLANIDEP